MKIKGILFFALLLAVMPVLAEDANIEQNKYLVLDNGLGVFIQNRDNIPLVNIVFAINMGSKDEDEKTSGMVHMLEHLLLLGDTQFHTSDVINLEMRRHGAQFNAHTSHDLMTFELSLPAQFWEFGLDILKEKLFDYKFTAERLDKEKEIIFEEISQHQDDPFTLGTQLTLQLLFDGHPYQQPIYGDEAVIKKAAVAEIADFYQRCVVPSNCSLAVVGDVNLADIEKKVQQVFGKLTKREKIKSTFKETMPLKKNVKVERNLDIKEAHLIFGFYAPPLNHPDQLGLDILKIVMGRGINPLLGRALYMRGKPLTHSIHTRYVALQYGGAFLIYLTLEPKKVKMVEREVINFLKTLWKFNFTVDDYPLGQQAYVTDYLEAVKNQVKFSHQKFQELGLNAAVSFAKYGLYYKDYKDEDESKKDSYMDRVEKIISADLRDAASNYLSGKKYVLVTILPEKEDK